MEFSRFKLFKILLKFFIVLLTCLHLYNNEAIADDPNVELEPSCTGDPCGVPTTPPALPCTVCTMSGVSLWLIDNNASKQTLDKSVL